MRHQLHLPAGARGRLDRAVCDALGLSRAAVKAAFAARAVRVEGRRARGGDPARPGALVELEVAERASAPAPEPGLPLSLLAESPRWLVADKPAGMATHALRAGEGGTLAHAVAARFPECAAASPDPREGGAVHRLDAETSGCNLFARDAAAWQALHAQFTARAVEKVYLALVLGRMAAGGVCSVPLAQRGRRSVPVPDRADPTARPAETHYEPLRRLPAHTLVEVRIATGAMHQIRAHLAWLGHPVAGDLLYGGESARVMGWEPVPGGPARSRHALHAARLAFDPPEGGPRVQVESPLPADLEALLARFA